MGTSAGTTELIRDSLSGISCTLFVDGGGRVKCTVLSCIFKSNIYEDDEDGNLFGIRSVHGDGSSASESKIKYYNLYKKSSITDANYNQYTCCT